MTVLSQVRILVTAAALELAMAGFVQNLAAEVGPQDAVPAAKPSGPLPDDGKTAVTITEVPIKKIEPPEKDFYAKELDYHGLPIKGAAVVSDAAFYEAWRHIDNLLRHNPMILQNLLRAGSEVHIIGKDQGQTDLPEFRRQKGVPLRENPRITLDERARGMGGRECSCGEENLLKLPGDRYRGRDILSHEFTHTIHGYGVSKNIRELVTKTYRSAREKKLWETPERHADLRRVQRRTNTLPSWRSGMSAAEATGRTRCPRCNPGRSSSRSTIPRGISWLMTSSAAD